MTTEEIELIDGQEDALELLMEGGESHSLVQSG